MTQRKCRQCGEWFKSITVHWGKSPTCDYPELSDGMKLKLRLAVASGLVELDAMNPRIRLMSTDRRKMDVWAEELDWMCSSIRKKTSPGDKHHPPSTSWRLRTLCHPWLLRFVDD